jgi:hypothetical protein
LREAGISQEQAEAHAEAAREFVMGEPVTKTDLQSAMQATRTDLQNNVHLLRTELQNAMQVAKADLQNAVQLLEAKIEAQTLRLTVRLGGLLAAGIALLPAVQKLV